MKNVKVVAIQRFYFEDKIYFPGEESYQIERVAKRWISRGIARHTIYKYAKENKLLLQSAIKDSEFREFFKNIKIKIIVEIGTFQGVSTAYMARFAENIFTFDIEDYPKKYKIWKDFKIINKIHYFTIKNRKEIKNILKNIKFDFAFIDGNHSYKNVKADFELVKHCGKVLFHDTNYPEQPDVKKFVEEIGAKIIGNIAYWIYNECEKDK